MFIHLIFHRTSFLHKRFLTFKKMQDEISIWKSEPLSPGRDLGLHAESNWRPIENHLLENAAVNDESVLYYEYEAHDIHKISNKHVALLREDPWKDDWLEKKIDLPICRQEPPQTFKNVDNKMQLINPAKVLPQRDYFPFIANSPLSEQNEEFDLVEEIDAFLNSTTTQFNETQPKDENSNDPIQLIAEKELLEAIILKQNPPYPVSNFTYGDQALAFLFNSNSSNVLSDSESKEDGNSNNSEFDETESLENNKRNSEEMYMDNESTTYSPGSDSIESTDDPDWSVNEKSKKSRKYKTRVLKDQQISKRKPYVKIRSENERYDRKKEQNKNAATKYRQRKKDEFKQVLEEEQELIEKNKKLKADCGDLEKELKILKSLLRPFYGLK